MDKTIGIFGGGQLGRMMAQAALPLNIQCTFLKQVQIALQQLWVRLFRLKLKMDYNNSLKAQMFLALNLKIRRWQMLMF